MRAIITVTVLVALLAVAGCGIKRDPNNVFPGSPAYDRRVEKLRLTPDEAAKLAYRKAKEDDQLQFVSRKPIAIVKNSYIFGMPQASGANLQGYQVDGNTGKVSFNKEKKQITHTTVKK